MIKTNYFKVLSKEDLQAFASKYALELTTKEEKYFLYSQKIFEGNTYSFCQELQKVLSKETLLLLNIKTQEQQFLIAIISDKITVKSASSITTPILSDISKL